jgi:MFS family permease
MFRLPLTPAARLTLAAALLMALAVGTRSSFGLFVSPLNTATGFGLAAIGLAAAFGQLAWGGAAPLVGWLADRFDTRRLVAGGLLGGAAFTGALAWAQSAGMLALLLVLGAVAGCAAGSNALLLGAVGRHVAPAQRPLASGIVSAGGSAGQMVIAPLTTIAIAGLGWSGAMVATAALMLMALPLARAFARPAVPLSAPAPAPAPAPALREAPAPVDATMPGPALPRILRSRDFWLIAGAFGVCGFHVTFLTMHMPGVIERCGLPLALAGPWLALLGLANIAGSIGIAPWVTRLGPARTLVLLYALRGVGVSLFVSMPVTVGSALAFAGWMGLTYMAVLPPMNELLGRRFGVAHLSTLLGVTMVVHQVGAFAGAGMGGWVVEASGSYDRVWLLDIALAALAAAMHLPLRERRVAGAVRGAIAATTDWAALPAR